MSIGLHINPSPTLNFLGSAERNISSIQIQIGDSVFIISYSWQSVSRKFYNMSQAYRSVHLHFGNWGGKKMWRSFYKCLMENVKNASEGGGNVKEIKRERLRVYLDFFFERRLSDDCCVQEKLQRSRTRDCTNERFF